MRPFGNDCSKTHFRQGIDIVKTGLGRNTEFFIEGLDVHIVFLFETRLISVAIHAETAVVRVVTAVLGTRPLQNPGPAPDRSFTLQLSLRSDVDVSLLLQLDDARYS